MQLYYWDGSENFGDALNPWLWPLLMPDFFDDDPRELLVGIGSNLGYPLPARARKIVCGTGFGGYAPPPRFDDTWDIRFVRGPRTAELLGLPAELAVGDAGMLLHVVGGALPDADAACAVGFMPHWESALYGVWETVCAESGVRFIDPNAPVERVIAAIRSCAVLVTEAMHGAIAADALRVPWVPFMPAPIHRFKWFDWAESQGVELVFSASARSSWLELASEALAGRPALRNLLQGRGRRFRSAGSSLLRAKACAALRAAARSRPHLSSDARHAATTDTMLARLAELRERAAA
jgi:succinoglycan biosynthesis protein ExoV